MSIFKDTPTTSFQLWRWLREKKPWAWVFSGIGVAVPIALISWLIAHQSGNNQGVQIQGQGDIHIKGGIHQTIQNNDPAVAKAIEALSRQLEVLSQQFADARQGEKAAIKAAIKEAITAIPKQTEIPDAQARIEEALAAAAKGNTTLAEAIFSEVEARKVTEGKTAYQAAAEAARHRGALAFLHDTDKAIAAYRRATELDPENADGWNQLGQLLYRTGALDDAEAAYRKIEALGKAKNNPEFLAIAHIGLGNIYETRGDPDQAEAMYHKSLAINEELGHKAYTAAIYGNLGILYQTRGDPDQAEAMYRKSLAIEKELGRKEGMASDYGSLGSLYLTRGELDQAEAMYRKALDLNKELGHKEGMAINYGNLGILYWSRGDLDQAEAMYHKALDLNKELGRKEGMASNYGNLGVLYRNRGDPDQAEAMYRKSLGLNKELGHKEGMASNYGNLGILYRSRGDPDQAEAMYRKSLGLFQAMGAVPKVEQVQGWLEELRSDRSGG